MLAVCLIGADSREEVPLPQKDVPPQIGAEDLKGKETERTFPAFERNTAPRYFAETDIADSLQKYKAHHEQLTKESDFTVIDTTRSSF